MIFAMLFVGLGLLWIIRGVDPLLILIECLIHLRAGIVGAAVEARKAGSAWWCGHPERVRTLRQELGA
jgi:hypothetical protein